MRTFPVLFPMLIALAFAHSAKAQAIRWTFDHLDSFTFANEGGAGSAFDLVGYLSEDGRVKKGNIQSSPGVGGKDSALDLTSTPSMGSSQGAHAVSMPGNPTAGWKAMTITGWYNASEEPSSTMLLRHTSSANVGWGLKFDGPNQLVLSMGKVNFLSEPAYTNGVGHWQFFAVTWSEDGAKWYAGTEKSSIEAVGQEFKKAEMNSEESPFVVGRGNSNGGAFRGFLDDIRIYQKELSAEEIEAVRKSSTP